MKLLVFTPTYAGGLLPECVESIRKQDVNVEWDWLIDDKDIFPPPDHRNVLAKYQRARQKVLEENYDALLTLEHDMVLPSNAFRLLVETKKPVVFGVYLLRHGSNVVNAFEYENDKNLGQSLSLNRRKFEQAKAKKVVRVSGVAWGCTYISREILQKVEFHDGNGDNPAGDLAFATDCLHQGIEMYARFDVPCVHVEKGKHLHPFKNDRGTMVKVTAQQNVNVLLDGRVAMLSAGVKYFIPEADAKELQRAGYVQIIEEPVEPAKSAEPVKPVKKAVKGKNKPFIQVLTRTFKRPKMLSANVASLEQQTNADFIQTILEDKIGVGVAAANAKLAEVEIVGQYVWVLDDDDVCIRPTLFEEIEKTVGMFNPSAIVVKMDHGSRGILPSEENWKEKDQIKEGGIGCSALFVKAEVFKKYKNAWKSGRYASDYDFARAVFDGEENIAWHDVIASKVQKISNGKSEV